jgi:hypothetical protein
MIAIGAHAPVAIVIWAIIVRDGGRIARYRAGRAA